ncbi:calcium homeostasis modulator protein 2-like isoform X2 [Syngnathus acus]|uniref:calcium homeostasis modulator protein 2-like isoform X2 n=1 Tax=Syngnathus acus TaxID=161584 RepID=UPI0018861F61|nr:calcium homeostasis modulator protein 2-like isoform X2 [Syngnathus acus]
MAAYALVTQNFKFASLFFKSKDVMIFNGLIALGTVASQTAYNVFAFDCPCSPGRNYYYGIAAIGAPALAFFIVGVMLNKRTWDLVSECRLRRFKKLSTAAAFAGLAYTCALSEFTDPSSVKGFPPGYYSEDMAKFPCKESVPTELQGFWAEIDRRLKYESQLIGWLVVAGTSLMVFLVMCTRHCSSPLGYQQEEYWKKYRANEKTLFRRTAAVHAQLMAAKYVESFFGFVALENDEKEHVLEHQAAASPICSTEWNRVSGVYLYREKNGLPLYSRLNKWATYNEQNAREEDFDKEMEVFDSLIA